MLALAAVRARDRIVSSNLATIKRNIEEVHRFMAEFSHIFEWQPPLASSVCFARCEPTGAGSRAGALEEGALIAEAGLYLPLGGPTFV